MSEAQGPNLAQLAKMLRGNLNGAWINIRGPDHGPNDRSLGIRFDGGAKDGFRIHSLAGDDPNQCHAYVKTLLEKFGKTGSFCVQDRPPLLDEISTRDLSVAIEIWSEAQSVQGSIAEAYLRARRCWHGLGRNFGDKLRFHPACPFGRFRFPALIAPVRDVVTSRTVGIHRTALADDGSGKRVIPEPLNAKMILGRAKGAAVMLRPSSLHLGIAEGIETALSACAVFKEPVWAVLSASGIISFPVIHGLKQLTIFADHDEAGLRAARICAHRHAKAGIEVEVRCPPEVNTDWNDYLTSKDNKHGH